MIKAEDIIKSYGNGESRFQVLKGISLDIEDNDFVVVLGASGSGKSTFLNVISGLERHDSGQVFYDGTDITALSDNEVTLFRKENVGFIFQQFNLLPVLTAKENIIMPLLLDKQQPDEVYLNQLTDLLGIRERMTHLPHELSSAVPTASPP